MSRIGKNPVIIPDGVTVEIKKDLIEIKGSNATLSVPRLKGISIESKDNQLIFSPEKTDKQTTSNWGTLRALVQNAVKGAVEDFTKELIIEGVGYRANLEGNVLVLGLGYSHPIKFAIPEGIKIEVNKNKLNITGYDKAVVGEVAAKIRSFRKPEPYKGKGIRYSDEVVHRKAGKKAVGAGGV